MLDPPLAGDGFLLFGLLEGLIGWPLSWLLVQRPSLAPFGVLSSVVALWVVLTAGVVAVGLTLTLPTVRGRDVWVVWAVLNGLATAVNGLAVVGSLPPGLAGYGYWHPWLVVLGVGYLVTATLNPGNPALRLSERVVYGTAGGVSLVVLALSVVDPTLLGRAFLIGGLLHVLPMGYDVAADAVLARR